MRMSNKRILGALALALAVAGLVAAGSSALTASNTVNGDNYAGYGSVSVTAAITEGIEHTLSADGTTVNFDAAHRHHRPDGWPRGQGRLRHDRPRGLHRHAQ
jgi:hypothetical protein